MHIWMLFLLGTAVYGISRISKPDLKAVNFAQEIEGYRLNGSVIKEIQVNSENYCQYECVEEERCQSYNIGPKTNNAEIFKCQLSGSDRFVGHDNFAQDEDFNYRGIQVILRLTISLHKPGR